MSQSTKKHEPNPRKIAEWAAEVCPDGSRASMDNLVRLVEGEIIGRPLAEDELLTLAGYYESGAIQLRDIARERALGG